MSGVEQQQDSRSDGHRDGHSDSRSDGHSDSRWLTYGELAELRGISSASARRLVQRNHWRRQRDNRGTVRILVPGHQMAADPSHARAAALQAALATLEARHALERAALIDRAETLQAELAAVEAAQQQQAEQLRAELRAAHGERDIVAAEVAELRAADATRRALPLRRRLWLAWQAR
jgi:hypothetical protein